MAERNAHKMLKKKNKPATTSMSIQKLSKSKNQKHTGIARDTDQKKNFFTDQEGKNRSNPKKNPPPPSEWK